MRYIAGAGLAVVWVLAGIVQGLRSWALSIPVFLFGLTLGADLMHYLRATRRYGRSADTAAEQVTSDEDPIQLDPEVRAEVDFWFTWKMRLAVSGMLTLAWAYVCIVFHEVPDWMFRLLHRTLGH